MFTEHLKWRYRVIVHSLAATLLLACAPAGQADPLSDAFTRGKVDFMARYRFEHVNDDLKTKNANANTIRFALGYKTGAFYGFRAYGQFERVQAVTRERYNDGENGKTSFPKIVDPEGTEFKQGYLSYEGFDKTLIKVGRQIITYRKAPFHRFIGTVLWRQNWQTHDAVTIVNESLPATKLSFAWLNQVNTITSKTEGIEGYLFNAKYNGLALAKLEGYAYLLDYDDTASFGKSTNTYGLRANGAYGLNDWTKLIYTGEYAHQTDAGSNPVSYDANYYLFEGGLKFKLNNPLNMILVKASYEVLGSDNGTKAFITPLGTNHAFQGWADRFLSTPASGIEDAYVTLVAKPFGTKFVAVYHDLSSNNGSFDYGTELDLLLTKTFRKHYTVGLKYANYNADSNSRNIAGPPSKDADKFWVYTTVKF